MLKMGFQLKTSTTFLFSRRPQSERVKKLNVQTLWSELSAIWRGLQLVWNLG